MTFSLYHRASEKTPTQKRMAPLMTPRDAPVTMRRFPSDFGHYEYVGPTTDIIDCPGPNGKMEARVCLLARMEWVSHSPDGPSAHFEMSCSWRDLVNAKHPQASAIGKSLNEYFVTKIQGAEPAADTTAKTKAKPQPTTNNRPAHVVRNQAVQRVTVAKQQPGISLFALLNSAS